MTTKAPWVEIWWDSWIAPYSFKITDASTGSSVHLVNRQEIRPIECRPIARCHRRLIGHLWRSGLMGKGRIDQTALDISTSTLGVSNRAVERRSFDTLYGEKETVAFMDVEGSWKALVSSFYISFPKLRAPPPDWPGNLCFNCQKACGLRASWTSRSDLPRASIMTARIWS